MTWPLGMRGLGVHFTWLLETGRATVGCWRSPIDFDVIDFTGSFVSVTSSMHHNFNEPVRRGFVCKVAVGTKWFMGNLPKQGWGHLVDAGCHDSRCLPCFSLPTLAGVQPCCWCYHSTCHMKGWHPSTFLFICIVDPSRTRAMNSTSSFKCLVQYLIYSRYLINKWKKKTGIKCLCSFAHCLWRTHHLSWNHMREVW